MGTYKFSKGSEWRKWDLHIHSNASDGKATPEEIIEEAKLKGISVIAITDHHTVENVDILKKLGEKDGIKVIAGIEFRTEYGKQSVHIIGLFPDYNNDKQQLTGKVLNDLILCKLGLYETEIIGKGKQDNQGITDEKALFKKGMHLFQVDFKEAAELIHNHGGLISVHAGSKDRSIEEMKHIGISPKNVPELCDSLGTLKDKLLNDYVDICEIRKENDSRDFYIDKFELPCIIASDAHTKDKIGEKFTWIKADMSFDGLKQILCEPESRVKIQSSIPEDKKNIISLKR
jgi:PHP family Zn ribbon phosphoesterase